MKSVEDIDLTPFGYIDCKTWEKAYGMFEPLETYERFRDTLLLHHMAPDRPDLTLHLGSTSLESESESGGDSDSEPDFDMRSEMRRRRKERRAKLRRYNMNVRHVSSRL